MNYEREKLTLTEEEFDAALDDYINDGINWEACKNTVIQADVGDVEQFAADSFNAGVVFVMKKLGVEWAPKKEEIE